MRILIDARLYGLENAGLGRYVMNLVSALSKIDNNNQYVILLRKKYYDLIQLPANWKKVLADYRHYSLSEQIYLPPTLFTEKPDIVHFPHFNIPLVFRGRFIVTIHDLLMHKQSGLAATTLPAPIYYLKRLGYRMIFKVAVKNSKAIIVPSNAVKDDLIKKYKNVSDKIVVTYQGIDENIIVGEKIKIDKPYFVYAGNAYPHKNLKRLIEATILLNNNSKQEIFLVIASSRNVFTKRLEQLVKSLKAEKYVKLLGFVKDEEYGSLLKNSEAFVFASLSEGFGLPGLEAMKLGTLVLASDIPVFREIYTTHAIYFDPFETASITRAMESALNLNSKKRQNLIDSARVFVNRYSWQKMAKETLEIYKEVVK